MTRCEKVGYVRVSRDEQHPENQIKALLEAGVCRDCIFIDHGVSGTVPADKRPAFKELRIFMKDHQEEVKFLYVFELSRLGRTTLETINVIADLERLGITVWSLSSNEGFTRSEDKAVRQLLLMVLSWVAERERLNLVERTKAGLQRARDEGKKLGRPRMDIDWKDVSRMKEEGLSWGEIASQLSLSEMQLYRRRRAAGLL